MDYAVFFITGRGDTQHAATIANLVNDTAAGFSDITTVPYAGATVPEIDAGYVTPTPLDTGHGGFTDGLFTKPPIGSYPAYLNKRVLRGRRSPRTGRAEPSSTSPAPAHTSSRRATTSSPTSATSSVISKAAMPTRRSRCRTRTTTSRRAAPGGSRTARRSGDSLRAWQPGRPCPRRDSSPSSPPTARSGASRSATCSFASVTDATSASRRASAARS